MSAGGRTDIRWTPQQQAVLKEREAELLVSAAAGSGKTAVLVERVVQAAVGEGGAAIPLEQLAVVTFTNAAAAELRARVHSALAARLSQTQAAGAPTLHLRDQLEALPRSSIATIHGLCGQILRRFGYLRGHSAARQLDAPEAQLLLNELAGSQLDRRLGDPADPLRAVALAWGGSEGSGPADSLRGGKGLRRPLLALHDFMCGLVDPVAWFNERLGQDLALDAPELDAPVVAALSAELAAWRDGVLASDAALARVLSAAHPGAVLLALLKRREAVLRVLDLASGWDSLAPTLARLKASQEDIKYKPSLLEAYRRDLKNTPWYDRLDGAYGKLSDEVKNWLALFATPWRVLAERENAVRALLRTLWGAVEELDSLYTRYKRERGLQDFADLERGALDVLSLPEAPALPSEAALALRGQYRLVLVDEYQDTSPLQAAILDLLTAEPLGAGRPRVLVGDVKQSIYAFRHAEPGLFREARERLGALDAALGRELQLTGNFRSRPAILHAVNYFFDGLMTEELGGEDYSANRLEPLQDYGALYAGHGGAARHDAPVQLHLLELQADAESEPDSLDSSVEAEEGAGDSANANEDATADAQSRFTAARIRELIAAGEPVYDTQAKTVRPAQWRDVAVLLRAARGRVEALKRALEEAGVPYYAPGRSGFYERPEVADALSLLRVIDNPRQDIALAAVLRGPAVRLEPAQLLRVAQCGADAAPPALWERVQAYIAEGADAELRERLRLFCARLAQWRTAARREPLPQVLWRLYHETGLLVASAALPGGEQRLANLYRLLELAQQFAGFERQGLPRFLEFLASNRRAAGDLGEAPLSGGAQNTVRVLTIHQAKGLEFPIVLLPDMQRKFFVSDLGADLLWHRQVGLGGRHYHWPQRAPAEGEPGLARYDTLSRRAVQRAKRLDLVAEELRLLYVGMTRARERLELIAAVKPGWQDKLPRETDPADVQSPLDWLNWRFGAMMTGLQPGLLNSTGPEGCWELAWRTEPPGVDSAELEYAPQASLTSVAVQELVQRLEWRYPHAAALALPAKLTVSRIAHRLPDVEADGTCLLPGDAAARREAQTPAPQLLVARDGRPTTITTPDAAAVGTATHRLLARLDYALHTTVDAVAGFRDELALRSVLENATAARIDCAAVARAVAELAPLLHAAGVQVWRELPLALALPAGEAAQALGREPEGMAHGEFVYLQGVVDLLLVTGEQALIVDFKTDRADAPMLLQRYSAQLEWYARAVGELLPGVRCTWALYGLREAGLVYGAAC